MPKRSIRAQFLSQRRALAASLRTALSAEIQERFLHSSLFHEAGCLALYSAIHNEVLTDEVAGCALDLGKTLVYPRVSNDCLEFVPVLGRFDLTPGAFGVLEPQGRGSLPVAAVDLMVVPGVVFDQSGHRLGYGHGFYDRALAACRADCVKVGFGFDFQLITALPAVRHDQRLSVLVTESRILYFAA